MNTSVLKYKDILRDYLISLGAGETFSIYLSLIVEFSALIVLVVSIDKGLKYAIVKTITRIAKTSKNKFDDHLIDNSAHKYLARIIPLIIFYKFTAFVFSDIIFVRDIVYRLTEVYGILLALWIVRSLLNSLRNFFRDQPTLKDKPVDSYIQVFMIFAWIAGAILSLAVITGTPVWKFFTALGAASAVILLVFQDSIKGFVASIQVSINDMVRLGDWITFEQYGADGDVIEINLATVKVQNFDKTITTIPTYALISDSFQNWRGMEESQGRRIKRSINIKQDSIHFLTKEQIEGLKKIQLIKTYLENIQEKIDKENTDKGVDKSQLINGRNLTNFGVFRKYIEEYLNQHSAVHQGMTLMVRHLQPTETGIPIEVYCFSEDKIWKNYEFIMADIFDHLIAAIPYFQLQIFESEDAKVLRSFVDLSGSE